MHVDPLLPSVVGIVLAVLILAALMRALKQPHVIAYLLAGIALGPHALAVITDVDVVARLGAFGIALLLFFVGLEVSPRQLAANWRVPVVGTLLSITACVAITMGVGRAYGWPMPRMVLMGFVISLSSTAVVLKVLDERGELTTRVGRNVLGVLLVQDLAVVPMMIVIGLLGGDVLDGPELAVQVAAGVVLFGLLAFVLRRETISLPLPAWVKADPEMQVFAAIGILCSLALATGLANLSAPLGAFAAGMVVGSAHQTEWVHERLEPFRVVFVALFFVSVGLSVDLAFLSERAAEVSLMVGAAITINVVIVTLVARMLGETWRESLYSALILSQLGEFGFLLATFGANSGIITREGEQLAIAVISVSLLASPLFIALGRRLTQSGAQ